MFFLVAAWRLKEWMHFEWKSTLPVSFVCFSFKSGVIFLACICFCLVSFYHYLFVQSGITFPLAATYREFCFGPVNHKLLLTIRNCDHRKIQLLENCLVLIIYNSWQNIFTDSLVFCFNEVMHWCNNPPFWKGYWLWWRRFWGIMKFDHFCSAL